MAVQTSALMPDISIIIISFNTREILRECLHSVFRESGSLALQVIVVDNASTDQSPEMIEKEFPQVDLIKSSTNLGFGQANNLGLPCARGRYIVLLNSDAFVTKGALENSVAHMDANPRAGLGGGRLVGRDNCDQPSARMFPTVLGDLIVLSGLAAKFPNSRFWGHADRTWASKNQAAEVDWVPGAYSILRPEALQAAGPFDPRFFLYYEEVDLCKRIKSHGYQIWYWPDTVIVHIGGESSRQVQSLELSSSGAQLILWRTRSMLLYYRKHHGYKAALALITEISWYWLRSQKRRWSGKSSAGSSHNGDHYLIAILRQAWSETQGGRLSPSQPW